MAIVYFGTPEFAVPTLSALIESGENVAAVVTQADKRRGRRGEPLPSPVKSRALDAGIRVLHPASMKDEAFIAELRSCNPEFFVVAAFGRILTEELLRMPLIAPVNLHASLLPLYRGASPIAWAILRGESETGLTTMLMSRGLDEGDILLQERFTINPDDTTGSLSLRLAEAGGPLILSTLRGMRDGSLTPHPQAGETVYAPLLTKEDGRIPWSRTAPEIERFVRAMSPWPGAFTDRGDLRLKIHRVRVTPGGGTPGHILGVSGEGMLVGTGGEGAIEILQLQPPGKRPMPASAYLQGSPIREGEELR